jgi:phosphatidylglycerophosphate synthase
MAAKDTRGRIAARSGDTPDGARPAHPAMAMIALTAVALGSVAAFAARELALGPLYVWKALAVFAVVAVLVAANLGAHPFGRFGPANQITLARGAFMALAAGLIGEQGGDALARFAFALAIAAAVPDAVDGPLARASGMASAFGARFDMETDAALLLVLAMLAWQFDKAGPWVLASGLARYAFVAAGAVAPWLRRPLPPSFRRKLVCAVQTAVLVAALAPVLAPPATGVLAAVGLAALCYSFAVDVIWLRRHSREDHP